MNHMTGRVAHRGKSHSSMKRWQRSRQPAQTCQQQELKVIKAELLKQPSIKAVSDKLGKVVKLNDKIKLPIKNLNTLVARQTRSTNL